MDSVGRITAGGEVIPASDSESARQRDSLFMIAQLRVAGEPDQFDVRIRNLSPGGLMMELDRVVGAGTAVTLTMRGLGEVTGTVAWCTRGRVGVAFDAPIDPKRARKPVGGGALTPDYAKPVFSARSPRR